MRYRYISIPSSSIPEWADSDQIPGVFISVLSLTSLLFATYEAFFDQSNVSKELEVIGLMAVVGVLEALQVAAINGLNDDHFLSALVAKNMVGQLVELLIYDDVKSGTLYSDYPVTSAVLTSVGIGALKVAGQVAGKLVSENRSSEGDVSLLTNFAASGVVMILVATEAIRENLTSSDNMQNTLYLAALVTGLFMVSAAQSIAVKKLTHSQYPYVASARQIASVGLSFALNTQMDVGDSWFESQNANLIYKSTVIASVKILGYLAGRTYILTEKESLAQHEEEIRPLLHNQDPV